MDKRSQNLQIADQLNRAVDGMFAGTNAGLEPGNEEVASLLNIARELRELPRESFKQNLKAQLERSISMATTLEPVTLVRATTSPRMTFKDAAAAIAFYEKAFGARELSRFQVEGSIPHAEIVIGDSVILITEEWPEGNRYSAETLGNSPVLMQIQVPDVDAFVERAISAGARQVLPIREQFYGRREGTLLDPFGYTWGVSTVTEEMTVQEMHERLQRQTAKKPSVEPIPKGYRTVTPYLVASDGPALMEFVKQAFGANETFRTVGAAGGLHGEVRIGDSMLMIGGGISGREFRSTPKTTALHLYVRDADAAYENALTAGATSISAPRDQEYGERSGTVTDPAGNFWYIATHKGENYVPKELNDVNCYLHPLRAEPLIRFLAQAFGGREIAKYASPDGVVHHAEIQVGSSVIEMGESQGIYKPMQSMFYLYVTDCDTTYKRALAAGASSISEPIDHPYGDRSASVRDVFGNEWYIATHIRDVQE